VPGDLDTGSVDWNNTQGPQVVLINKSYVENNQRVELPPEALRELKKRKGSLLKFGVSPWRPAHGRANSPWT